MKWSTNCLRTVLHFKYYEQASKMFAQFDCTKRKKSNQMLPVGLPLSCTGLAFCQKADPFIHHQTAYSRKFSHAFSITFARTARQTAQPNFSKQTMRHCDYVFLIKLSKRKYYSNIGAGPTEKLILYKSSTNMKLILSNLHSTVYPKKLAKQRKWGNQLPQNV